MELIELPDWAGDTPIYLVINIGDHVTIIDLDKEGWKDDNAIALAATPAIWYLCSKNQNMLIGGIIVEPGDAPAYVARHVGIGSMAPRPDGTPVTNEIVAYGLGKTRENGTSEQLWFMGNGFVCSGTDLESFALQWIKRGVA